MCCGSPPPPRNTRVMDTLSTRKWRVPHPHVWKGLLIYNLGLLLSNGIKGCAFPQVYDYHDDYNVTTFPRAAVEEDPGAECRVVTEFSEGGGALSEVVCDENG